MGESIYDYSQVGVWNWIFLAYFFGVMATFVLALVSIDDISYAKGKKFSWSAFTIVIIFALFSWFGFLALVKFESKHPPTNPY